MSSSLFPNTAGMVNDTAPAPSQGPRPMDAGMARQLYPDNAKPFVVSDPTKPMSPGERYRGSAGSGSRFYPNTEGMRGDDTGKPDGMPSADDPAVKSYEVPLPQDFQADEAQMGELKALAVKHGLRPQAAGELVGLHAKALQAQQAQLDADIAGWRAASEKLPEWTDPARPAALEAVRRVLPPTSRAFLDGTAFGSHPAVVQMVLALGREIVRLKGDSGRYNNTPGMRP